MITEPASFLKDYDLLENTFLHHYQPYHELCKSKSEWLQSVPCHWREKRLKYAVMLRNDTIDEIENNSMYIGLEHIESWTGGLINTKNESIIEGSGNKFLVDDILFGKLRPYLAKVHHALTNGICSSELLVLYSIDLTPRNLFYYLINRYFVEVVDSSTYGAKMPRANWQFISNLTVLIPPTNEQQMITSFLDHATAKIDALLTKKQRLIELLNEKRIALICHAVTKGLDQKAPLRSSGIEWIGDIPEHWGIGPIRHLCDSIQTGPFGSQLHQSDYLPMGIPVINPVNLIDGRIIPNDNSAVSEYTRRCLSRHILIPEDIVFARRGEIGRCGLVEVDQAGWLCGTGCMRLRLIRCNPYYYNYVFNSYGFSIMLTLNAIGTTMMNINTNILARSTVPIPPYEEQELIAKYLKDETKRIDKLIQKVEEAISCLNEYRSALISAAVTGKIDVRQHVHELEAGLL